MKALVMFSVILGLAVLPGCSYRSAMVSPGIATEPAYLAESPILGRQPLETASTDNVALPEVTAEESATSFLAAPESIGRKMTYSASYILGVYQSSPVMTKLEDLAKEFDGYIQRQTVDTIILRIPSNNFTKARSSIESLGRVIEKSIEADDVTEKYTDLALRLKMRQAYLQELQDLLAKTTDVKQMLAIRQEIAKTVEEIEVIQGKLKYLANRVAFSIIAVRLVRIHEQEGARIRLPFYWIQTLGLEYLLERY